MSEILSEHQKMGKFTNIDGLNIFIIDRGKGPAILLLHGLFTTSYSFRKIIPTLAENFRVIAFDYPGIGLSEKPPWTYSHRQIAKFTSTLIDKIIQERVHLVAYDYAAAVSFLLLNENPEKVKTLTLVSPFKTLHKLRYYTPLFFLHKRIIGNIFSMMIGKNFLRFIFNRYMLKSSKKITDDVLEDYEFLLLHGNNRNNFLKLCQNIDRGVYAKKDMEDGMKKMIGGRQIILGNQDKLVASNEIENIKEYMRLSLTQTIHAGHLIMEDEPEELSSKIENFVRAFSRK